MTRFLVSRNVFAAALASAPKKTASIFLEVACPGKRFSILGDLSVLTGSLGTRCSR